MGVLDIIVFVLFIAAVLTLGLVKSKSEAETESKGAADYFLAGRGLTWWLVGFSLIAANISTEQFVGMSGQAADWLGMAIASYEWMAAITLVVVAFVFLPKFLRAGIYTIPEFLEYRYNAFARTVMAIVTMIILVGVPTASVIFSGAKVITVFFQGQSLLGFDLGNITVGCWIIAILAAAYVCVGGLKACAWADLLQGAALIVGGAVILVLVMKVLGAADPEVLVAAAANPDVTVDALRQSGAIERFFMLNDGPLPEGKLHMVRPASDPSIPWPALVVGLWIPNFFYWGLNQYITQRTLGSKSLGEGQKGVVFAAALKLIIPFIVVIPGILAFNLFSQDLRAEADKKNAPIIEQLDAGAEMLFRFNGQFADIHPELAARIVAHNQSWSEVEVVGESLVEQNEAVVVAVKETQPIPVSNLLAGYDFDAAFPTLLRRVVPQGNGILGFVLAAIFGAVVSSLASMLNSASTIFTMDIYHKVRKRASQSELVSVGRVCTLLFVLIAVCIAPNLGAPEFSGIFTFIQEFQGFISPGVLAIFVFGILVQKAPRVVGTVGLLMNPILYGALKVWAPQIAFLNRMAICMGAVLLVLALITWLRPLKEPVELPVNDAISLEGSRGAKWAGWGVVLATIALYIIFW